MKRTYGALPETMRDMELYDRCMSTVKNNGFDTDEIKAAGLTPVKADKVNAPLIDECFMNLECRLRWEKEIVPGDDYVLACLEIVNVHVDERHLDENDLGRTGGDGDTLQYPSPRGPGELRRHRPRLRGDSQKAERLCGVLR